MKTNKREGENYIGGSHINDAAFQSPEEKKKNQEQDFAQNGDEQHPAAQPKTNATLGKGNQMEGEEKKADFDKDKLNP